MSTITTKFSIGDVCYVVIHPTADILQCVVSYIRITPSNPANSIITYKVQRTNAPQVIDYLQETEVFTFTEAKAELLSWLSTQTARISAMSEPPPPTVA